MHREGGKVELLRETYEGSQRALVGIQMRFSSQQKQSSYKPVGPQPPGKSFHSSPDEHRSFSAEFDEFILQTWMDMVAESAQTETGSTKSPLNAKTVDSQPVFSPGLLKNSVRRGRRVLPIISYWTRTPQQPLKEAAVDCQRGNKNSGFLCLSLILKSLELKNFSLAFENRRLSQGLQ